MSQVAVAVGTFDRPVSLFVADFIGSPAMNFLPFRGSLQAGAQAIRLGDRDVAATPAADAARDYRRGQG